MAGLTFILLSLSKNEGSLEKPGPRALRLL